MTIVGPEDTGGVTLDQTRAGVDYEGGAYDPGTCPYCGGDPRHPQVIGGDGYRQFICSASFHKICDRPPKGWNCTRPRGHDGPCAAHPDQPSFPRLFWNLLVERFGLAGAIALAVIQVTVLGQFAFLLWLIFFS